MISSKKFANYIFENYENANSNFAKSFSVGDLLNILKKFNLEKNAAQILKSLKYLQEKKKKENTLFISSSHSLSPENVDKIRERVTNSFTSLEKGQGDVGMNLEINVKEDLLAGFVAKFKGKVYDASAASKLLK